MVKIRCGKCGRETEKEIAWIVVRKQRRRNPCSPDPRHSMVVSFSFVFSSEGELSMALHSTFSSVVEAAGPRPGVRNARRAVMGLKNVTQPRRPRSVGPWFSMTASSSPAVSLGRFSRRLLGPTRMNVE